jgi:hypothetical protein
MKGLNSACLVLALTEGCLRLGFESHSMMEGTEERTGSSAREKAREREAHEHASGWLWINGII